MLKLKVDLGKCYKVKGGRIKKPDDPRRMTWMNEGYDSAWSPAGVGGQRGEHCVRDPKRMQVVDVYLMDTVKAGDAGYRVMPVPEHEEAEPPTTGTGWEWKSQANRSCCARRPRYLNHAERCVLEQGSQLETLQGRAVRGD